MDCVINGTLLEACYSNVNVLFVDSHKEVFFDIIEFNIDGISFISECVKKTLNGPVVTVKKITIKDKVYENINFMLVQDSADIRVHINESNIYADIDIPMQQEIVLETVTPIDTSSQARFAILKEEAFANIAKEKKKLEVIKEQVEETNSLIESKLTEYKSSLLEHYYKVIEENKDAFTILAQKKFDIILEELKASNNEMFVDSGSKIISKHIDEIKVLFDTEKQTMIDSLQKQVSESITAEINEITENINAAIALQSREHDKTTEEHDAKILKFLKEELEVSNKKLDNVFEESKEKLLKDFIIVNTQIRDTLKADSKKTVDDALASLQEQHTANFDQVVATLYEKFTNQYGPKVDATLTELLENKTGDVLVEKFDFFKTKKVNQHLEQLTNEAYNKREPELIRKVKKLIMDFYYSYGTGGGSGNVTIVTGTSGGGGGGTTTTPYAAINTSGLAGTSAVIDFFPLSAFKTAKYNIEVLSGSDVYTSEISVAGNTIVGKYTEFAVLYTTATPFISYSVVTTGTYLQLIVIASTNLTNMFFRGVRLDPIFQ